MNGAFHGIEKSHVIVAYIYLRSYIYLFFKRPAPRWNHNSNPVCRGDFNVVLNHDFHHDEYKKSYDTYLQLHEHTNEATRNYRYMER